jgi:hypothetical protein
MNEIGMTWNLARNEISAWLTNKSDQTNKEIVGWQGMKLAPASNEIVPDKKEIADWLGMKEKRNRTWLGMKYQAG